MKKITIIFVLIFTLVLTACSSQSGINGRYERTVKYGSTIDEFSTNYEILTLKDDNTFTIESYFERVYSSGSNFTSTFKGELTLNLTGTYEYTKTELTLSYQINEQNYVDYFDRVDDTFVEINETWGTVFHQYKRITSDEKVKFAGKYNYNSDASKTPKLFDATKIAVIEVEGINYQFKSLDGVVNFSGKITF